MKKKLSTLFNKIKTKSLNLIYLTTPQLSLSNYIFYYNFQKYVLIFFIHFNSTYNKMIGIKHHLNWSLNKYFMVKVLKITYLVQKNTFQPLSSKHQKRLQMADWNSNCYCGCNFMHLYLMCVSKGPTQRKRPCSTLLVFSEAFDICVRRHWCVAIERHQKIAADLPAAKNGDAVFFLEELVSVLVFFSKKFLFFWFWLRLPGHWNCNMYDKYVSIIKIRLS